MGGKMRMGGMVGGLVVGLDHGFPLRDGNPSTMLLVLVSDAPGRHQSLESTLIKFYFSKRDDASQPARITLGSCDFGAPSGESTSQPVNQ